MGDSLAMPACRSIVRWLSTALGLAGWVGALLLGVTLGAAAGVNTWFIAALSVGIAFTVVAGVWWVVPDRTAREEHAAVFALGVREGIALNSVPRPPHKAPPDTKRLQAVP